jgi:benzoate membrane transport protein
MTLAAGTAFAAALGLIDFSHFRVALARPVFTMPHFSLSTAMSIGVPLFVVAMTSQNMPGLAVLRADGYTTPSAPLIATTGVASLLLAPFGSHGVTLAAITAAICTGPEAHEDRTKRYTAALWCGFFYLVAGVFGATIAALFAALPKALIVSVAAPRTLRLDHGWPHECNEPHARTRSRACHVHGDGLTLLSIGSAFWGLVAGLLTHVILNARK